MFTLHHFNVQVKFVFSFQNAKTAFPLKIPRKSTRHPQKQHQTTSQIRFKYISKSIKINQSNQIKLDLSTKKVHPFQQIPKSSPRHAVAQVANASTPMALKPLIFDLTKRQRCRVASTSKVSAARRLNSPVRK